MENSQRILLLKERASAAGINTEVKLTATGFIVDFWRDVEYNFLHVPLEFSLNLDSIENDFTLAEESISMIEELNKEKDMKYQLAKNIFDKLSPEEKESLKQNIHLFQ